MIDALFTLGLLGTVGAAIAFFWTREPRYGFWAAALLAALPLLHAIVWLTSPAQDVRSTARAAALSITVLFDLIALAAAACLAWLAKRRRDTM
jgi:uncharacterized membrane protein HdeD (DUF308 family)